MKFNATTLLLYDKLRRLKKHFYWNFFQTVLELPWSFFFLNEFFLACRMLLYFNMNFSIFFLIFYDLIFVLVSIEIYYLLSSICSLPFRGALKTQGKI